MKKLTTTFAELKASGACAARYRHLAEALGGIDKYGSTTPITSLQILEANGENDTVWAWENCPSLKPIYDDYLAKRKVIYDDYLAKRKVIEDDYLAKRKVIEDDCLTKRKVIEDDCLTKLKVIEDDYRGKLKPIIRQVAEEWS